MQTGSGRAPDPRSGRGAASGWSPGPPALPCRAMSPRPDQHPPKMRRSPRPARRPRAIGRLPGPLLAGLLAAAGLACDRNIEPFEPGEVPRSPDLARIFPGAPAGGMRGGAEAGGAAAALAADAQEAGAGAARGAFPPTRTEGAGTVAAADAGGAAASTAGAGAASAGSPITGRIEVAPELAGSLPAGAILFVIARPEGAVGGPPLAVLRIPEPEFPVAFEIGPGDVMIPSMRFAGPIALTARLDSDGNAMTRAGSDLSSPAAPPAEPGTTGVVLVLSQKG